jgi:hypothetical protein
MFKEAEKDNKEVFMKYEEALIQIRSEALLSFCMTMLTDGIKYKNKEQEFKNYDIAELMHRHESVKHKAE